MERWPILAAWGYSQPPVLEQLLHTSRINGKHGETLPVSRSHSTECMRQLRRPPPIRPTKPWKSGSVMRPSLSLAPTHKPKRNSTLRSLHLCHYCPLESIRTCKKAGQDAKSIRLASSKPQPKYAHLSSAVLKPNLGWTHNDPCLSLPFHGPLQLPRTWKRFQVVVPWPLAPFFCNIKTRQKPSQNISEQPDKKKRCQADPSCMFLHSCSSKCPEPSVSNRRKACHKNAVKHNDMHIYLSLLNYC